MTVSFKRWIPMSVLALMLASCFVSEKPLFTEKEADYPIADGTRFQMRELPVKTGATTHQVTISREGALYVYSEAGEEPSKGMMDELGDGSYAAEMQGEDGMVYALFQKRDGKWLRHSMNCADFEALAVKEGKSLADFGIEKKSSDCNFTKYDDLKRALAFQSAYGAPDAEYTEVK